MDEYFWKKLEDDLHPIPNFIKNGFTMTGFWSPMSFKEVTDAEINAVENFIKTETFGFLTKKLCDVSVDNECEVIIDDEHLIDYFGLLYANDTTKFQFQLGDKMLIKELVKYVKNKIDGGGPKKNANYFMNKRHLNQLQRRRKAITTFTQIKKVKTAAEFNENDLKSQLIEKVIPYFNHANIGELQFEEIVKLHINDKGKVYGDIFCAICKAEGRKNQKAKRVCCNFVNKSNGCWVLSNFMKHLERVHKIYVHKNKNKKVPALKEKKESDDLEKREENDSSVILTNDEELKILESKNCDTPDLLYDQISRQITLMMEAVLKNSEAQSQMNFVLGKSPRKLMVATIAGDGNCMYTSLAHQLFSHKINSKNHRDAAKKLRSDVVEHILNPDNFALFLPELKDRVYQIKKRHEIEDIETECKMFVRHILAKNKSWGGKETLLAISDLYATNIIVFDEDGACHKFKRGGKNYNRSIAVAYRVGSYEEGKPVRIHYDSVCDDTAQFWAVLSQVPNERRFFYYKSSVVSVALNFNIRTGSYDILTLYLTSIILQINILHIR